MKIPDSVFTFVIELYIKELMYIFRIAPKLKDNLVLYRAINDNYIAKNKSKDYVSNQITSASLMLTVEMYYARHSDKIYEITVKKGIPVIFMDPISLIKGEMEFILPINSIFYIDYGVKITRYYDYHYNNFICYDEIDRYNYKELKITSVICVN